MVVNLIFQGRVERYTVFVKIAKGRPDLSCDTVALLFLAIHHC